jgi:hypothetical protein
VTPTTIDASGSDAAASATAIPAAKLTLRDLPETLLKPIPGFSYRRTPGQVIYPSTASGPQVWEGGLVRSIVDDDGVYVAGAQLIRVRGERSVEGPVRDMVLRDALESFVPEGEFAPVRMVDQEVLTATKILDGQRDIAGWFDGRDLVIIIGTEEMSGKDLAFSYLTGKKPWRLSS